MLRPPNLAYCFLLDADCLAGHHSQAVAPQSILAAFLHPRSGTAEQLAHATQGVSTGCNLLLFASQDSQLHHTTVSHTSWATRKAPGAAPWHWRYPVSSGAAHGTHADGRGSQHGQSGLGLGSRQPRPAPEHYCAFLAHFRGPPAPWGLHLRFNTRAQGTTRTLTAAGHMSSCPHAKAVTLHMCALCSPRLPLPPQVVCQGSPPFFSLLQESFLYGHAARAETWRFHLV